MKGNGTHKRSTTQEPTRPLSGREREILGLLADGMSGAAIAEHLVLSPETVRTHIRNAMGKLGASTRSHAVVLALEQEEIEQSAPAPAPAPAPVRAETDDSRAALTELVAGLSALADIDAASIYLAREGGMILRLAAHSSERASGSTAPAGEIGLGNEGIGRVALERRAQVVPTHGPAGSMLVAPMVRNGRLVGVLALLVRSSRPTSHGELLLLQVFGTRLAEILTAGTEPRALQGALQRFRASWRGALDT